MDVSKQTYIGGNDTTAGNSMYLSFDAESTMSSAAFKTIEASDIEIYNTDSNDYLKNAANLNSTLEADEESIAKSPIKTVKRISQNTAPSPLRAFSKNIMKEFNAMCSTPSKEQIMRSVDVKRGSDTEGCFDLGAAFKDVDDDRKGQFEMVTGNAVDKENLEPDNGGGDISEVSASVDVLSLAVEQKLAMLSTTDEESVIETKQTFAKCTKQDSIDVDEPTPKPMPKNTTKIKPATVAANPKLRYSVLPTKTARKSVCEPSLHYNRPSRIIDARKRNSLIPIDKKLAKTTSEDIPELIDRMMKISNTVETVQISKPGTVTHKPAAFEQKKQIQINKKRSSTVTNAQGEKRTFAFTQRMSVVVKTTLNSPARKIPRRSVMPVPISGRKSVRPAEQNTAQRRSLMPTKKVGATDRDAVISKLPSLAERPTTSTKIIVRQSMCPLPSSLLPIGTKATASKARQSIAPKSETLYTCGVCNSTFRIKSLFDAHKRSHEGDITPTPGTVKKQVSNALTTSQNSSNSSLSSTNKCKYCDKKFALVRALHIHLLEKCSKIPPGDKRKLQYTEMDHVEKAQLPHFHHANANNAVGKGALQKSHSSISSGPISSSESLIEKEKTVIRRETTYKAKSTIDLVTTVDNVDAALAAMEPPTSSTKIHKKVAHAGVYRTPSKTLPCHLCKQTFRSILDYTNHSMTVHSTNAAANKLSQGTKNAQKST